MTQLGEPIAIGVIGPADDPESVQPWAFDEAFQFVDWAGVAIGNVRYEILKSDGSRVSGVSDDQGKIPRLKDPSPLGVKVRFLGVAKTA